MIKDDPQSAGAATAAEPQPVVVKKYANRRLYNTESSSYITLDSLAEMVRQGRDFVVYDAKSGEDITRGVLTQIIVEEEGKGRAMLPTGFLRQIIGFYGDNMQSLVPRYLEQSMQAFALQQQQMRRAMQQTMGTFFPFGGIEEVNRQQAAMMERAMHLFAPLYKVETGETAATSQADGQHAGRASAQSRLDEVDALRGELETLKAELEAKIAAAAPQQPPAPPSPQVLLSPAADLPSPEPRSSEPPSFEPQPSEPRAPELRVVNGPAHHGQPPQPGAIKPRGRVSSKE